MPPGAIQSTHSAAAAHHWAAAAPARPPGEEVNDPLRLLAFRMGLGLIFLRLGMLHFVLSLLLNVNTYLLYVVGLPTLLGLLLSGGIRRSFRGTPAWYWTAFLIWIALAIPSSTWRGGSFATLVSYAKSEYPMLLVMGGLALNWKECRSIMAVVAWSGVLNLAFTRIFQREAGARIGLDFGIVGNPNDFAAHLLLVLPFLLWFGFAAKFRLIRLASLGGVAFGVYTVMSTASRGAAVAVLVCIAFTFLLAPFRRRLALVALAPICAAAIVAFLPVQTWERIRSISSSDPEAVAEAVASTEIRQRILKQSVVDTLEHPIFGVGPSQFATFEGMIRNSQWLEAHNTLTQISSECGIPALLLYLAGFFSTFRLFFSIYRQARARRDCADIRDAAFCLMLAMTGYFVATFFLTFGYYFYMPAMGGFSIAMSAAARREIEERSSRPQPAPPPWARASAAAFPG